LVQVLRRLKDSERKQRKRDDKKVETECEDIKSSLIRREGEGSSDGSRTKEDFYVHKTVDKWLNLHLYSITLRGSGREVRRRGSVRGRRNK
jgi:hypothetical protein